MRHDPVASPQDGTPTKQVSDKTRLRNRCGGLWARMHRQDTSMCRATSTERILEVVVNTIILHLKPSRNLYAMEKCAS